MKKITKILLSFAIIMSIFVSQAALAAPGDLELKDLGTEEVAAGINLGDKSPIATATSLINTAMIFLGLIAVCIVLLGGFKWMTAGGGEEKITEAKKLMSAGVVGIIIILSAWGAASWILTTAVDVTK